jgi:hypothetical protein
MRILPVLFLLTVLASSAVADGGMIAPYQYEIYEDTQLAFLRHFEGMEDLHILPKLRSEARAFAWIVPTPAVPTVALSETQLFNELSWMSQPEYRSRDDGWSCSSSEADYGIAQPADGGVEILEDSILGDYHVLVLGADDAAALADSLTAWGFLHDGNAAALRPLLDDYVERGWSFTAVRIDPSLFPDKTPPVEYWYGGLQPLRLTFAATEPVYPLKISSISAAGTSRVVLYAAADRRLDFPGATTTYANRLTEAELTAMRGRYPTAAAFFAAGDFVTKLERPYAPAEMDADLVLETADTQGEYLRIHYSGLPVTAGLLLALAGWMLYRRRRV